MAYVSVIVIDPEGQEYDAEVDENARDEALLLDLVEQLGLDSTDEDGRDIEYRIHLIGGARVQKGVTIRVERVEPSSVRGLKRRK
jgi:hypothetical protein